MATSAKPKQRSRSHPKLTPAKIAEFDRIGDQIDRDEKEEIVGQGRDFFARRDQIRKVIQELRAARRKKGLSLEEVGRRTGIGKANLARLEGERVQNPTLDTFLRVADAVGYKLLA